MTLEVTEDEFAIDMTLEQELFYVQDSRTYVGNSVSWWALEGKGYTTDLSKAMKVDRNWHGRESDILWSCVLIDAGVTKQFDMQKLRYIMNDNKEKLNVS